MSEDNAQATGQETGQATVHENTQAKGSVPPANEVTQDKGYTTVYADLEKWKNKARSMEERLAKIDEDAAEAKRQAEIEAGNFKTVESEYKTQLKELKQQLKVFQDQETARLEAAQKKLDGMLKDLTPEQKALIEKGKPAGVDYQLELANAYAAAKSTQPASTVPRSYPAPSNTAEQGYTMDGTPLLEYETMKGS